MGTRTRSCTTGSRSTPASSSTTSATTRCSAAVRASSASPRTSRTCRSRSVAAAAASSTRAGGRSRSRANAASPRFLALLWEIGRWLRTARPEDESQSLAEYLDLHRYSQALPASFPRALTSALWSTAPGRALEFPAAYAIRFFDNHGMLGFGRFRWRTVTGGSRRYVDAIAARLGRPAPPRRRRALRARARGRRRAADRRPRSSASTRSCSPRTPTRRSRCSRIRRRDERRVLGTFAYTRERRRPAHRFVASCRAPAPHARPGTTGSAKTVARRSPTT